LMWSVSLPLFTNWMIRGCICTVSEFDPEICFAGEDFTPETVFNNWYTGVLEICVMVAISMVCSEVGSMIYRVSI
jgi:hypothetical protein